jgi:hypothetical protein
MSFGMPDWLYYCCAPLIVSVLFMGVVNTAVILGIIVSCYVTFF